MRSLLSIGSKLTRNCFALCEQSVHALTYNNPSSCPLYIQGTLTMDSNRPTKRLIHHYIKQHRGWHNVCSLTAVRKAHMRVIVSGIAVLVTCLLVTNLILERRNGRGGNFLHLLRLGGINAGAPARLRQDLPLLGKARSYVSYDCGGGCAKSNILLLQTSDGGSTSTYSKMLDALQSTHLAYAAQRGFHYLRWDGLMKGRQAWHATYNRIFLLHALHESRRYEWVLFLDPDAIVRDPRLNVEDLLDDRYAVLGCRGGDDPDLFWDINIGVAFFNLRHKEFGSLMKEWMAAVQKVAPWTLERGGGTAAYITMGQGPRVRDDQQVKEKKGANVAEPKRDLRRVNPTYASYRPCAEEETTFLVDGTGHII